VTSDKGQMTLDKGQRAIVIGAGIGGLTAGALLAKRGYQVRVFDSSIVPGGCASTFRRRGFTFDVGATQVAGLEPGGIHHRIFSELGVEVPEARYCDPACAVFLPGETEPINVWRDPDKWRAERQKQFPGSDSFWQLLSTLFQASWRFQSRDPVLPPRNLWDVTELIKAIRPDTLVTVPFTLMTVGDALRLCGVGGDKRLKTFLDLQLKLYSQVGADETALLYAATALGVSQAPLGLFHLQGSMQVLSDRLVEALEKHGGELLMQHTVKAIHVGNDISVTVLNQKTGEIFLDSADHIVANVTVQNLVKMVDGAQKPGFLGRVFAGKEPQDLENRFLNRNRFLSYRRRVEKLVSPSGAFVVYLGVRQDAIPDNCPPHLQFLYDWDGPVGENNSLFVSVSHPGDGRATEEMATITASSFTDVALWTDCDDYDELKERYTAEAVRRLGMYFDLSPENIVHCEAGTPRTFARYTGRDRGIVGGVGQRISTFGPFGFATRTPIPRLWLVGDSTHPGEGTAGVSYSALTAVRQIENEGQLSRLSHCYLN